MAEALITLESIAKFRNDRAVLRSVNLRVSPGELHLILGANGAGKSTLLRIMAGLLRPSAGEITRGDGLTIAYLGHPTFLYNGLTALENLRFQAHIHKITLSRTQLLSLLEQVDLTAHAHTKTRFFSRGMAQRLNFCRALMPGCQLFLLDEPFTGLDLASRKTMRDKLREQREAGRGIVLVSHDPDTDSQMASHCHCLVSGKLQSREK